MVYDGCSEKAKTALQRNHNYAAKALLGRRKRSSATEALQELRWLPLEQRRRIHIGVFVHKAINGNTSKHGIEMVRGLRPQHHYSTRQVERNFLYNRTHSTKQLEKSISYRAAKVWNDIPQKHKNLETAASLKNAWQGSMIDFFVTQH